MESKTESNWLRLPILGLDLFTAALIYLISIILLYSNTPTAAELGFSINSAEVTNQQLYIVLLGIGIWFIYSVLSGLIFGRSLGHLLIGTKPEGSNNSKFKQIISTLFLPLMFFDKILHLNIIRLKKNTLTKVFTFLGGLASLIAIPGIFLYLFLLGFVILTPKGQISDDLTLCGEKFCLVKPNYSCPKNLDLIRSRVVEIVGQNFTGTGFLISDSLVLTNYHVVENESEVNIRENNRRVSPGKLYKSDPDLDIALIIGQFTKGQHIQFVDPKLFTEGTTELFVIGYPGQAVRAAGTGSVTVTSGIYSSFLDYAEDGFQLVQTDAAVNPGNSGGPLVNKCGQVFGMVTLGERFDPITGDIKEGLNYAISSTTLVPELNKLSSDSSSQIYSGENDLNDVLNVSLIGVENNTEVELRISNIPSDVKSIEYEFTYLTGDGLPRGVLGKVTTEGEQEIFSDIVLGTCASGRCVYDIGVNKIDLSLTLNSDSEKQYFKKTFNLLSINNQQPPEDNIKLLISKVGSLIALPSDEEPTIATVNDLNELKDQEFFNNAKLGDKVLMYPKNKKAILYRPSTNQVIETGPLEIPT